ncbi:hypothetical protein SAMN05444387_4587 [Flavobacterium pectinovorum]|uniref:DUF2946 domain-containing protein n=1 Tax=Flavobacterium pectinovorum TaxID=29533 RepID=A0ABY1J9N2_9FLAO|nr:hypothetical protein SAMN05444387_4587 [Flavobacterium pectinovorum]
MSFIILIISFMPCADMEMNNAAQKTAQFTETHIDHSHDTQNDLCSPFCVCSCCGVQVLSYASAINFDFHVIGALIKRPLPNYISVLASNFYGSIWQPPQIV